MRLFLLLCLTLIGAVQSLVPGNEYLYYYEGKSSVAMPEVRFRASTVGMKCNVHIQVVAPTDVRFKLDDLKFGEYIGDYDCEYPQSSSLRYRPISGVSSLLEEPFSVDLRDSEGVLMRVPKADPIWVTNIRKAIVNSFLIDPIKQNLRGSSGSGPLPDAFFIQEPSIVGDCISDYTLSNSSFSGHQQPGQGRLYSMEKSVDFEQCKDQTFLQEISTGNTSFSYEAQTRSLTSRSSVMFANLTYDDQYYRLINSSVTGVFSMNPFGHETEKVMAIANQTLILQSEKKIGNKIKVTTSVREVKTWLMEFFSPYARGGDSPKWMYYGNADSPADQPLLQETITTGVVPSDDKEKKMLQDRLKELLKRTYDQLRKEGGPVPDKGNLGPFMTDEASIVAQMESASRVIRGLDYQSLEDMFDYFNQIAQQTQDDLQLRLYIDGLGASGVSAPLKVIVNRLNKNEISLNRTASVFFALPNNLVATTVIDQLTKYVKTLSIDQNPFLTPLIWINYATTLNRVCLNAQKYWYSVPWQLFGKDACKPQAIINDILPFFESELHKAQHPWQQIAIVHAIGNLGSTQSLNTLDRVVTSDLYPQVRGDAIYSLTSARMPYGIREHVFKVLMPVVFNVTEDLYVRQSAVATLLTWNPPPSWFQRMAIASWRETSNNMASFFYFLLEGIARNEDPVFDKHSRVARFVLPMAKPYAPSWRYSYSYFFARFIQKDYITTDFDLTSMKDSSSSVPRNLYTFIINSFGGLRFSLFQGGLSRGPRPVSELFSKMAKIVPEKWNSFVRSSTNRRAQEIFSDLDERMIERNPEPNEDYTNLFLSFFDNLEILLPLSEDSVTKAFFKEASQFVKNLSGGKYNTFLTKYFNPLVIDLSLPSETGFAVLARASVPSIIGGDSQSVLTADGKRGPSIFDVFQADQVTFNSTCNLKLASKTMSSIRIMMPWAEKSAVCAIQAHKGMSLPFNFWVNITGDSSSLKNFSLSVSPTYSKQYPFLHFHSVPFVIIKNMWPGQKPDDLTNYLLINAKGDKSGVMELESPINKSYTGVEGTTRWEGDAPYPFTLGNLLDYYKHPEKASELLTSPVSRLWAWTWIPDLERSETKQISSSFAFSWPSSSNRKSGQEPVFKIGKGLSSNDYALYTNLLLNGSTTRYYEAHVKVSPSEHKEDTQTYEIDVVSGRSPIPPLDQSSSAFCLSLQETCPTIRSLRDLRRVLSSNAEITLDGKLRGGVSCSDKDIATIKGNLKLSDERRKLLWKELNADCEHDPSDPMVRFHTAPVYDHVSLSIDYKEPVPRDLKNASYHAYDSIRGLSFPHVYFNYMDINNQPSKIKVYGDRFISDNAWNIRAELPTETVNFDKVKPPESVAHIVPIWGVPHTHPLRVNAAKVLYESQISNQCIITKNKVRTFDGFSYNYSPEYCDTYAFTDRTNKSHPVVMIGVEYKSGMMKALVGSSSTGLTLLSNATTLEVDGKELSLTKERTEIKDSRGNMFAEARKTPLFLEIIVPGNFSVQVYREKILVTPSEQMRRKSGGLCGNYNGDSHEKLVGPKDCIYTDEKLFGYSWTKYGGLGCDYRDYRKEQEAVERYQKNCPKAQTSPRSTLLPKYDPIPSDCIEYVYKTKKYDGSLCVTDDVVAICHPLCKLTKARDYKEIYDCWPEDVAPREIEKSLKRGYIRHKISRRPIVQSGWSTEHAQICERK